MKEFYTFPDPSDLEAQRKELQNRRSEIKNKIAQRTKQLETDATKKKAASTKRSNLRTRLKKASSSQRQNNYRELPKVTARHLAESSTRVLEQTAPLLQKIELQGAREKYLKQLGAEYASKKASTLASLASPNFIPGGEPEKAMLAELEKMAGMIRATAAEYNMPTPSAIEEPVAVSRKEKPVYLRSTPHKPNEVAVEETAEATETPEAVETPPTEPEKRWVRNPNMYPGLQERGRKIKADAQAREEIRKQREATLEQKLTGTETPNEPVLEAPTPVTTETETPNGKKAESAPYKKENVFANTIANREGMSMEQKPIPKTNRERLESKLAETLPGFDTLPEGKKLLVLQGMEDSLYAHVKEHGKKEYEEYSKKGNIFLRSYKSIVKNGLTMGIEKDILSEINSDHNGRLTSLIKGQGAELLKQFSQGELTAYLSEDKKTIITDFAGMQRETGRTPLFYNLANEYNEASSKLARVPYEWSLADATSAQRAAYKKAEQAVTIAEGRYLTQLEMDGRTEGSPSPKALAAAKMLEVDTSVKTMRFLSAHPDAAKRLNDIENKPFAHMLVRGFVDQAQSRGKYFVAGFVARKVASLGLSLAAAPIISSALGYWRGRDRAKDSLRERAAASRRGDFQKGSMSYGTGSAQRRISRLQETLVKIDATKSPLEKQNLLSELKTQVDFVNTKIELGQLNFGKEEGRLGRQFEIMRLISESQLTIEAEMHKPELAKVWYTDVDGTTHVPVQSNGDARTRGLLERMGAKNQEAVAVSQKEMIHRAAVKSAVYGGLFAGAGVIARHFGEEFGWFEHSHHGTVVKESSTANTPSPKGEPSENVLSQTEKDFAEKSKALGESYTRIYKALTGEQATPDTTSVQTIEVPTEDVSEIVTDPETGVTETESVIGSEESLAHVTVSSRGIGQTILDFRNSSEFRNLTPEQQKFFEGNVYKVAEKLKEFDPETGRGVSVGEGSEFGINKHGEIYITDTNEGGKLYEIGVLAEDGSLETPYDSDITEGPETPNQGPEMPKATPTISATETFESRHPDSWKYVRGKSAAEFMNMNENDLRAEFRKLHEEIEAKMKETGLTDFGNRTVEEELAFLNNTEAREIRPNADSDVYNYPEGMNENVVRRLASRGVRHYRHELDKEFGSRNFFGATRHSGEKSEAWKTIAGQEVNVLFGGDIESEPEEYRGFLTKIRSLAEKYPRVVKNGTVSTYVRALYQEQSLAKYLANRGATLDVVE